MLAQAERSPATQESSPTPLWRLAAPVVMGLGLLAGSKENSAASEVPGAKTAHHLAGLSFPPVAAITPGQSHELSRLELDRAEQAASSDEFGQRLWDGANTPLGSAFVYSVAAVLGAASGLGFFRGRLAERNDKMRVLVEELSRQVGFRMDRRSEQPSRPTILNEFRAYTANLGALSAFNDLAQPESGVSFEKKEKMMLRTAAAWEEGHSLMESCAFWTASLSGLLGLGAALALNGYPHILLAGGASFIIIAAGMIVPIRHFQRQVDEVAGVWFRDLKRHLSPRSSDGSSG